MAGFSMTDKGSKTLLRTIWITGYIALIVTMLILLAVTILQRAEDNQRIIDTSFNVK